MSEAKVELSPDYLVATIFALSKASCGYHDVPHDLWYLHCCCYNEVIYELVNQIDADSIEGVEERAYIKLLQKRTKEDFEEKAE